VQNKEPFENIISKLRFGKPVAVTVDFSCLDKVIQPDMKAVWDWDKGILELKAAKDMISEFDKANPNVKQKLMEQYLRLSKLKPSPGAVFNQCMFNEVAFNEPPTTRDGKDVSYYFSEFKKLMFPAELGNENDFYDVMHISIHYLFSRDVFLTRNLRHFSPHELQKKFKDLVILTPQQLLNLLNDALGNSQVKS
jgi:hypothetical protein